MNYKIHLKLNSKTYFIKTIEVVSKVDQELPTSTITWTTVKSDAKKFEEAKAIQLLGILSTNGRDYRSSTY